LNSLVIAEGILSPDFKSGHFHYDVHVRPTVEELHVVIGLNMHLYNPRHLPKVTVDYEDVELNPLKPMQGIVKLQEDETARVITVVVSDPEVAYHKTEYHLKVNKAPNQRDMTLLYGLYAEDELGNPLELRPPFDPKHRNSYHASTNSRYIFWFPTCMPEASLLVEQQPWPNGQYYPVEVKKMSEGRNSIFAACAVYDEAGDLAQHPYMLSASKTANTSAVNVSLILLPQDGECHFVNATLPSRHYKCVTGNIKARFIALFESDDVEVLLRHKRHGHRAAPLKHRLYPNVPTMLPTHMDMELVLAVIAGDSRTEIPVYLKHHYPKDETLDMVWIHVALHLADGTCTTPPDAPNNVTCYARRHHVRFTVHWSQGSILTDGLYGTLVDKQGNKWHIDYGIASDLIPLSTTSEHYTDRHFQLIMKTPYSAPRIIYIHVINQGPNQAESFGGDVLNDVQLGPTLPLSPPQLV